MAVALSLNYTRAGTANTGNSLTIANYVHPGGDMLVLAHIRATTDTITGITYGGTGLTQIVQSTQGGADPGETSAAFRGAFSGQTANVVISYSASIVADAVYICSVTGHNTSAPIDSSGANQGTTTATIAVTHNRIAADTFTVFSACRGRGGTAISFTAVSPLGEIADNDGGTNTVATCLDTYQESTSGSLGRAVTPSSTAKFAAVCVSYATASVGAMTVTASGVTGMSAFGGVPLISPVGFSPEEHTTPDLYACSPVG